MIDLCLEGYQLLPEILPGTQCLQLLGLPRPQDLAHGDRGGRYMKLEVDLIVSLAQGDAPGCSQQMFAPPFVYSQAPKLRCGKLRFDLARVGGFLAC